METKKEWGGTRQGAGRPKSPYLERSIKIRCTAAEYREIIEATTPRQRVEIVLEWLMENQDKT